MLGILPLCGLNIGAKQNNLNPKKPNKIITEAQSFSEQHGLNKDYVVYIDMSLPSNKKRFFVYNLFENKKVYEALVAHGKGSGRGKQAMFFSDKPESKCTSLGKYKLASSYVGKHGKSYKLIGLEKTNKNAEKRAIVIHSANYVSEDFVEKYDRCGNSFGCPALSPEDFRACETYFKAGVLIWINN